MHRVRRNLNPMTHPTRRHLLSHAVLTTTFPFVATGSNLPAPHLKILILGAHPGDPEAGCGGTIARYTDAGHDVVALYLTRGEAGLTGKTHEQAASIRTAEAEAACRILKARAAFAG